MIKQLTDGQKQALAARLSHAKQYEGLHEVNDAAKLRSLIAKAPGGSNLNLASDGWCAHFVGSIDAELGYVPYGGRAAEIGTAQVEIDPRIAPPGCTVAFHGHAAFLDDVLQHIFGGNQSNEVNSLHMRYFGEPIGYFIPKEIAELTEASLIVEDSPIQGYEYRHKVEGGEWSPWKRCDEDMLLSKCSDDDIRAEYERRFPTDATTEAIEEDVPEDDIITHPDEGPETPEGSVSANDVAQELMETLPRDARFHAFCMETGEIVKVQPFVLTDAHFQIPTREAFEAELDKLDPGVWVEESNDCEDIARKAVQSFHEAGIKSTGCVFSWSGKHAFCVAIVQDEGAIDALFFEPQTKEILGADKLGRGNYKLDNVLMIIS